MLPTLLFFCLIGLQQCVAPDPCTTVFKYAPAGSEEDLFCRITRGGWWENREGIVMDGMDICDNVVRAHAATPFDETHPSAWNVMKDCFERRLAFKKKQMEHAASPVNKLERVIDLSMDFLFNVTDAALTHMVAFTLDMQVLLRKYHDDVRRL